MGSSAGIELDTGSLILNSGAQIDASTAGEGNSGPVQIIATDSISLAGNNSLGLANAITSVVNTDAMGSSSGITITTNSLMLNDRAFIDASTLGVGDAGDIKISTESLDLKDGSTISAITFGKGDAGLVKVTASGAISLLGIGSQGEPSSINSGVEPKAVGSSGGIELTAASISLNDGAIVDTSTFGVGDAGDIEILTGALDLKGGSLVSAITFSDGDAGQIEINANDAISLSGVTSQGRNSAISSEVGPEAVGSSTGIEIITASLSLQDGAQVSASTFGVGDAGSITITADQSVSLTGESSLGSGSAIDSEVGVGGEGSAGGIEIHTGSLSLNNGAQLTASTFGTGDAGRVAITARNIISLAGTNSLGSGSAIDSEVGPGAQGSSGGIEIKTETLSLNDRAQVSASTEGAGNTGLITVQATKNTSLTNGSQLSSTVEQNGTGDAQQVNLRTPFLSLQNNSRISAATFGVGSAGQVFVQEAEVITLNNSTISTAINEGATTTQPSNIELQTQTLTLSNGAEITASTVGQGDAGSVTINSDSVDITQGSSIETLTRSIAQAGDIIIDANQQLIITQANSGLFAQTESGGNAGDINLTTPQLTISEGAVVSAQTSDAGDGGSILIDALQAVTLGANSQLTVETSGAGQAGDIAINSAIVTIGEDAQLSATATETATNLDGGGSIDINASQLNISGQLGIFAETQGQTPAGTLTLRPDGNQPNLTIQFSDNGFISASTIASGQGGDINIFAPQAIDIRGSGTIAVEATGSGDAGNIDITTQTLTLADGLEISASTTGAGNAGSINIDANQIDIQQTTVNAFTNGLGNAGSITFSHQGEDADYITLDNSFISTEIQFQGQADSPSNITIKTDDLALNDSTVTASTSGTGNAGDIIVSDAETITLNHSEISASTSGMGNTGGIALTANQALELNNSRIRSSVQESAVGDSQQIIIDTPDLTLTGGSEISAATSSTGNAGQVSAVNADSVSLDNSTLSTAINEGATTTQPSNIELQTQILTLSNGAEITASTAGQGNAGSITVLNADSIDLDNSTITTQVESTAQPNPNGTSTLSAASRK